MRHSILRAAGLALSAGLCGLYSLASLLQVLPASATQGRAPSLIGMAVFLPFAAYQVWRMIDRKPVITISPAGFLDRRVAAQTIPWSGIVNIAEGEQRRNRFVLVTPDEATVANLELTATARLYRDGLRASGIDGLRIAAQGLDASHAQLVAALARHWRPAAAADVAPTQAVPETADQSSAGASRAAGI